MIYGIGVDLVKISRIRDAMDRWGKRFVDRVFTDVERDYCGSGAACYALRFAAKEALAKALGTGMRRGIRFTQIEVVNDTLGKPCFHFYEDANDLCREVGIRDTFVSLSDDGEYAVAMVLLEI